MLAELLVKELPLTVAVPPRSLARPPPEAGGVAGEGAAAHRRRPEVDEAAAIGAGGVAGEGAAAHRRRPTTLVGEAAAEGGGVAGEGAAAHRRRPDVGEAAARVLAELLVKELPLTVAVPKLTRPPPKVAELLVKGCRSPSPSRRWRGRRHDAGGVAGEGAAAHRRRPEVEEAAAVVAGGVAGEGAVAHRRRPGVGEAAAEERRSCW